MKVRDPEITSFYLEVKFELQNNRPPIIRMNVLRPLAADKKDKKTQVYNRTLKDPVEKQPQFALMVEGARHLMLNMDKEENDGWLQRFEKENIEDPRKKIRTLMNDKYAYKPAAQTIKPEAETAESTAVKKKQPRGRKPKPAAAPTADADAPAVDKAAAAVPKADEANAAAPKAETDEAALIAAELAQAEDVLKGAEARFAAAPDEDTRSWLLIAQSTVARLKRQQIAQDRASSEADKAAAAAPKADEANAAAPKAEAETDEAAVTAAELAQAEKILKGAEAWFAAAPSEDTSGWLKTAQSSVARLKRQQIAPSVPVQGRASSEADTVVSAEAEAIAEVAEAEAVLKDAEACFAAAPSEDTRGEVQIAKSCVARMKRKQIVADRVQARSAPSVPVQVPTRDKGRASSEADTLPNAQAPELAKINLKALQQNIERRQPSQPAKDAPSKDIWIALPLSLSLSLSLFSLSLSLSLSQFIPVERMEVYELRRTALHLLLLLRRLIFMEDVFQTLTLPSIRAILVMLPMRHDSES